MNKELLKRRKLEILVSLFLLLVTVAIFAQTAAFDFVNYDDPENITQNPYVRDGINPNSIRWAFSSGGKTGDYNPLTWLSHMLNCEIFGLDPAGHHLTNVFFHTANAVLLFWVLRFMTGALWPSAFVATVFAVHPLRVESVAWITERKDVLLGLFWIFTMAAYTRYARRPSFARYFVVFVTVAAAMLSKVLSITLPFVLLLIDYWPLGRLWPQKSDLSANPKLSCPPASLIRLVVEKIPFFVMAAAVSVAAYIVDRIVGSVTSASNLATVVRLSNGLVSYVKYILMMIWPNRLAVLYPHPGAGLPNWQPIVSLVILAAITVGVIYAGRKWRYLAVGWFWYLGTLVPTIGIVQAGAQSHADRYTYVPLVGLYIMIAWGLPDLLAKWRYKKIVLGAATIVIIPVLSVCSFLQTRYWRNSITLFERAVSVTRNNSQMHYNLGTALTRHDRLGEAIIQLRKAIDIRPDYSDAHFNLANALKTQGKFNEAVNHYRLSLLVRPDNAEAHNNLAIVLRAQGKIDEAIYHYHLALKINPDYARAYNNLGSALLAQNRLDEAIDSFHRALQIKPDYATAQRNLQVALKLRDKSE